MRKVARARLPVLCLVLPLSGCTCDDPIARREGEVEVLPKVLDFGRVALNSTKELPLTLKNLGSVVLTIDDFRTAPPFLAPTGTATVGTYDQTSVEVGFRPTELGKSEGLLRMSTTDRDVPTVEIALVGEGIEAAIVVDPAEVDFGDVVWVEGRTPERRTVTVSNPGTDSFDLTAIALDGDAGGAFGVDPKASKRTFPPGSSDAFEVTFAPNALGALAGSVRLETTAPAAREVVIPLRGKGVGAKMKICAGVTGEAELCSGAADQPKIDFGYIDRNATGQGRIRVINDGDRDLVITQILASGQTDELSFMPALDAPLPITIASGAENKWDVSYLPTDYEFDSVLLTFVTNTTPVSASSVTVRGDIKRPIVRIRPTTMTFRLSGGAERGQTDVRVWNCGRAPLVLSRDVQIRQTAGAGQAFSLERAPAAGTSIMPHPGCEADNTTTVFWVIFEPPSNGQYKAVVDIESNDPLTPATKVDVEATKS